MRDVLTAALRDALSQLGVEPPGEIHLERPARREHGDWSSNVALASAKAAGRNPRELARRSWTSASTPRRRRTWPRSRSPGPGFVNFHLDDRWLHDADPGVVTEAGADYGRPDLGAGTQGHGRVRLGQPDRARPRRPRPWAPPTATRWPGCWRSRGHDVSGEFYVNDRGVQMQTLRRVAGGPQGGPGAARGAATRAQYITEWAARDARRRRPARVGRGPRARGPARGARPARRHLRRLVLRARHGGDRGHRGDARRPAGAGRGLRRRTVPSGCGPPTSATTRTGSWSRATASTPTCCPTSPTTGTSSPGASTLLINVWGADHHGYVPRMKAAIQALGHDPDDLEVVITQLVRLRTGRRGGAALQADRRPRSPSTTSSTRSAPTPSASPTCCSRSTRPQTIDLDLIVASSRTRTRSSTCSTPTPASTPSAARPPSGASSGRRWRRSTCRCSPTSASSSCCARCPSCPRSWSLAARERAPHKVTTWVRELAGAVPRLLPRLLHPERRHAPTT